MRAVVYTESGDSSVLDLVEREAAEPGPGEVRVRIVRAGVNPTDWKFRAGGMGELAFPEIVPGQDGAGVVDAVGPGRRPTSPSATGSGRCWPSTPVPGGTAQEQVVLPVANVTALPDAASFDVGASLGVPAITAHRALTTSEDGPDRLAPGRAGRADRARRRRRRCGRQRRDPARPVGRRHRDQHGQQRREGRPGHGRRRPAHRELPRGRHRRGDPRAGPGRRRHRRRGGAGAEPAPRRPGHQAPRHDRDLRQQRRRRGHPQRARDLLDQRALPVGAALHRGPGGAAGRGRGHHRRPRGRRLRGRRRARPAACTTTRSTRRPRPTPRSRTAPSARCCSTWPTPEATRFGRMAESPTHDRVVGKLQALVRIPTVSDRDPDLVDTAAFDRLLARAGARSSRCLHDGSS